MAKTRPDLPPGTGDKGPLFEEAVKQNEADTRNGPAGGTPEQMAAHAAGASDQKTQGRKTTRGMLPEIKCVDVCYKELADLEPAEARWVLEFLLLKFPKPE